VHRALERVPLDDPRCSAPVVLWKRWPPPLPPKQGLPDLATRVSSWPRLLAVVAAEGRGGGARLSP